jgi:hypothetical protein
VTHVSIYEALRVIVRTLPGGEELAGMNDEWIRRGGVAVLPPEGAHLRPIFRSAVALLGQAIQSRGVDVIVCDRKIEAHERGYGLNLREAMLIHPFGRPPLTDVLICSEDLERFAAPPAIAEPPKRVGKGGRRPTFDPALIADVVRDLVAKRGNPIEDPTPGWRSFADVIKAVNEYLVEAGQEEMSQTRAYELVSPLLDPTDSGN